MKGGIRWDKGTAWQVTLIMELVHGVDLQRLLERHRGSLPEPAARTVFQQLLVVVDFCHRLGKVRPAVVDMCAYTLWPVRPPSPPIYTNPFFRLTIMFDTSCVRVCVCVRMCVGVRACVLCCVFVCACVV